MRNEEYVEKYTCGSCRHFRFEGNNEKGRCEEYCAYYWPVDSCKSRWEEAPDYYRCKRPMCK